MLRCIGEKGRQGDLERAHRCFRALRLLESARWWLRTLLGENGLTPAVYRVPVETVKNEFLCRIERLTRAKTPREIEQIYLEMVRSYP